MGQYVVFLFFVYFYEGMKVIKYKEQHVQFPFKMRKMPVTKFRYSSPDGKMMFLRKLSLTHIQC